VTENRIADASPLVVELHKDLELELGGSVLKDPDRLIVVVGVDKDIP
jgi:hypothetical protein